jgi:hypothetical protein
MSEENISPLKEDLGVNDFDYAKFFTVERPAAGPDAMMHRLAYFVLCVESGRAPPRWILLDVAQRLRLVLTGGEWDSSFPLPWRETREISSPLSSKGERALDIYADVKHQLEASPEKTTEAALRAIAGERSLSYETTRADYYSIKKVFDGGDLPDNLLNQKRKI